MVPSSICKFGNEFLQVIRESRGWMLVRKEYRIKVRELNDRLMMAERAFTDRDGLSSRPWYKHLVLH